jgi:hypothetical protein
MLQPPYLPDLSPPDYFLFPSLKMNLKGHHYAGVGEVQEIVTDEFKKIPKEEFSAAFQILYDRAKGCIYRVIQEESAILWELIVCVILSKMFI